MYILHIYCTIVYSYLYYTGIRHIYYIYFTYAMYTFILIHLSMLYYTLYLFTHIYTSLFTLFSYTIYSYYIQVYLKSLWNGKYLDYDNSKSDHHDSIMADMLAGHWYCRATDLESFLSKQHLCVCYMYCV